MATPSGMATPGGSTVIPGSLGEFGAARGTVLAVKLGSYIISKSRLLRKTRLNTDKKGFCDIFGRTFAHLR